MEVAILKTCNSHLRARCILPATHFWTSLNFCRNEHLARKVKDSQQLPNKLSTLHVPSRYSGKMYQIVKPLVDVRFIEENISLIERSCRLRGIEFDKENLIPLLKEWEILKVAYLNKTARDREYVEEKHLLSPNSTVELERLKAEQGLNLDSLKKVKNELYDLEDTLMPLIQLIPNTVSDTTPIGEDVVEVDTGVPDVFAMASHVNIGKSMGLLEFSDVSPSAYYLRGKFAVLEMRVQEYFFDAFKDLGYSPMLCTDFCKSFIIEAIGLDPYLNDDCIPLKPKDPRDIGQKLNLVGGASFASFCAYFTNMNVATVTLPSKYFSLGRCYTAKHRKATTLDLFSVVQSTNIHLLLLCKGREDMEFDVLFETLVSVYRTFKMPFRTVNVGLRNLNPTESRKKQIELWSPSRHAFVPVSWLSSRGDFVSKRLKISLGEECKIHGYCRVVEGVAVNVSVLVGCIVENFQNQNGTFDFPEVLKNCGV